MPPVAGSRDASRSPLLVRLAPAVARLVPATAGAVAWGGVFVACAAATGTTWGAWPILLGMPALAGIADRLGRVASDGPGEAATMESAPPSLAAMPAVVVRDEGAFVTVLDDAPAQAVPRLLVSAEAARLLPPEELAAVCHQRLAFATEGGTALGHAIAHGARTAVFVERTLLAPFRTPLIGVPAALLLLPMLPALAAGVVLLRWACRAAGLLLLRPALRVLEARASAHAGAPPALLLRAAARLDLGSGVPAHRVDWEPAAIGGPAAAGGVFGVLAPAFAERHAMLVALGADSLGGTAMTRPSWLLGTAAGAGRFFLVPLAVVAGALLVALAAAGPVWLELQALEAARVLGEGARQLLRLASTP